MRNENRLESMGSCLSTLPRRSRGKVNHFQLVTTHSRSLHWRNTSWPRTIRMLWLHLHLSTRQIRTPYTQYPHQLNLCQLVTTRIRSCLVEKRAFRANPVCWDHCAPIALEYNLPVLQISHELLPDLMDMCQMGKVCMFHSPRQHTTQLSSLKVDLALRCSIFNSGTAF